jgi:hypothetical protein
MEHQMDEFIISHQTYNRLRADAEMPFHAAAKTVSIGKKTFFKIVLSPAAAAWLENFARDGETNDEVISRLIESRKYKI